MVDGEAGIGKTTLLRAWAARRAAAGDTVLLAPCGPLDRAMPLDALLTALAGLLRRLGPEAAGDVLGSDEAVLAPVLGGTPGATPVTAPGRAAGRPPGRPWPTACSARRCCTPPWSGCWPGWPNAPRWSSW